MFKQSSSVKWAQIHKYVNRTGGFCSLKRLWIHPPEVLKGGHVAYLVKFLGNIEVNQPIGTEVVRQGINQLKFTHNMKKSVGGKIQRVELTISVDVVAIQDFKTKEIFYQYPLHQISYCANDNANKRFISIVAQEETGKYSCLVCFSNKQSQEITQTIGQAFDLAYSRFLDSSGRDMEMKKKYMILQKRVQDLEVENAELNQKISELQSSKDKIDEDKKNQNETFLMELSHFGFQTNVVGDRIENFISHDTGDFIPRTELVTLNGISHIQNGQVQVLSDGMEKSKDLLGTEPFTHLSKTYDAEDPFGMGKFNYFNVKPQKLENDIGYFDKQILEMKDGFSSGHSFDKEDFLLESLDPLYNKIF